jgi:hypothetical protein
MRSGVHCNDCQHIDRLDSECKIYNKKIKSTVALRKCKKFKLAERMKEKEKIAKWAEALLKENQELKERLSQFALKEQESQP